MRVETNRMEIELQDWLNPLDPADHFPHPERPLEVDIGCGKGRFLLARAAAHPDTNYLGIDRMLRRVRKVDRKATQRSLDNLRLLRMDAYYATTFLLPANAVQTFYVFFPDPWPKDRHRSHRLFDDRFNEAIHRTLIPGGQIHIATDHLPYFEAIRGILQGDRRWTPVAPFVPRAEERTDFEMLFLGLKPIGRCSFRKEEAR